MKKNKKINIKYSIKDMPEEDRPQEKLLKYGVEYLSNAELIALIIRTGTKEDTAVELSQKILSIANEKAKLNESTLKSLMTCNHKDLMALDGIGISKATMIIAAIELGKRMQEVSVGKNLRVTSPEEMANYIMKDLMYLEVEEFKIAILNTKKEIEKVKTISKGTINATIVHPRDVFKNAISENAHTIILIHNHPTGDPTPSKEDMEITNNLIDIGKLVKINVIDHIIIGKNKYYSFLEEGLI